MKISLSSFEVKKAILAYIDSKAGMYHSEADVELCLNGVTDHRLVPNNCDSVCTVTYPSDNFGDMATGD